jgi:rhamnogalacturonan acetylesterase
MSKLSLLRTVKRTALRLLCSLFVIGFVGVGLHAQDPSKAIPMEGATTDPATHTKIGLKPPASPNLPTLFLVGDSTVRNGHADGAGVNGVGVNL